MNSILRQSEVAASAPSESQAAQAASMKGQALYMYQAADPTEVEHISQSTY